MYIKEKYSVKKQIAILNCHQPLNTWQIACKLDLIYLMFCRFTKGFLKSHLQVFKSFVCIFAIISMLMTGLTFTFVLLNKMWDYKKKKKPKVISLGQVYGVHLGISGFPFDLNRKKMLAHLNYSPLLPSCMTMKIHIEFYIHNREG